MAESEATEQTSTLWEFVEARRDAILGDWEALVRKLPCARSLPSERVRGRIPEILRAVGRSLRMTRGEAPADALAGLPTLHALARLEDGFDLYSIVSELSSLRETIYERWTVDVAPMSRTPDIQRLDAAIDSAICRTVVRYARARERTLEALDRVAMIALESRDVDSLLSRLLAVFLDSAASADSATILLRDGDHLEVRGSVGLAEVYPASRTIRIGEGFLGKIAAQREPRALDDAESEEFDDRVRWSGIHAVYGVPLLHEDQIVGVAHMASHSGAEFAAEDRQLFRRMASRATAAIVHHQIRDAAEHHAARVEALERERQDLVNMVVHDLKTPLTTILGSAQLASLLLRHPERPQSIERARDRLLKIESQVDATRRLLEDFLDARMLADGRFRMRPSRLDYAVLLEDLCDSWRTVSPRHTIVLDVVSSLAVFADALRVSQIVNNLLSNAVKYSPGGGEIRIRATRENGTVTTTIRDSGIGIPFGERDRIFDRYGRLAEVGASDPGGHGIGLSITAALVRAHGGRIWVEDDPGLNGTAFSFTLPSAA